MVLTFIGYRGSGKSSLAGVLAPRLGWAWVDADHEIERRAGRSIREIFQSDGEAAFRTLECEVMADLLARDQLIVAAGGGAVLDGDTRRRMKLAGPVVWLTAGVDTLHARITRHAEQGHARPALTDLGGGREEIATVLARREPLYREVADVIVDTDGRDVEALAAEILRAVEPWLRREPHPQKGPQETDRPGPPHEGSVS
jgi:shikimate kinase